MKIGTLTLSNRVIQAPLAGVGDHAYRVISRAMGCALTFSEMISDKGLIYGQKRTLHMIQATHEVRPLAVQLFGNTPETLAQATKIAAENGADLIDINMGCPAPKVIKNFEGSALLKDLPRAQTLIRAVVQATSLPVTVKMRRGWEQNDDACYELAAIAEAEGAAAITIHPRTRAQFFSGAADWQVITALKQQVKIPVIGNGDIWSAEDALRMITETGCDAVMIGRAAMGNPFVFREAVSLVENGVSCPPPTWEERRETALRHLDLAISDKGETVAVREMRKHFSWYIKGCHGAAKIRQNINAANTQEEMTAALALVQMG